MSTDEEKLSLARGFAIKGAPYFASVIYGFVPVAMKGIRTMLVTPKLILGYDPEWVGRGTIEELGADLIHEVHHVRRKTFERGQFFPDKKLVNIAADLAINWDMRIAGWKLEKGSLFPEMYDLPGGLVMEEYYRLLDKMKNENGGKLPPPDRSAKGKGIPGKGPAGDEKEEEEEDEDGSVCSGNCGGIGGSDAQKEIERELDATPDLGREPLEVQAIEKKLAGDIRKHVREKGRGSVPADLLDWAETFEEQSPVPWREELASEIRDMTGQVQAGGDDYSMRRPSKRSVMRGYARPGMVEHLPVVAIVRDSSGSMGPRQLTIAAREAYFAIEALGIDTVWFADADTRVAVPWKEVGASFFKTLTEVYGRGGTDFRPAIESALYLMPKPDIIIYITDGDGSTTDMPPPNVGVIWAIVPSYYNKAPASWGKCIIISDDPKVRSKGVTR